MKFEVLATSEEEGKPTIVIHKVESPEGKILLIEERDKKGKTVSLKKTTLEGKILEYINVRETNRLNTKEKILSDLGLNVNDLTVLNNINLDLPEEEQED